MSTQDYIYFLHDRTTGTVKIGTSTQPEQRLKTLQATIPLDLVPLRVVPVADGYHAEHMLHVKFAPLRVRGEWFRAEAELLEYALHGDLSLLGRPAPSAVQPLSAAGSRYSLEDVAQATGVTARTLRYYIAQKVLHPPWSMGRSAHYDQAHIDRVQEVVRLQKAGLSLQDLVIPPLQPTTTVKGVACEVFPLTEDVQVMVSGNLPAWRRHQLMKALGVLERNLGEDPTEG